jgi:Tfp pilus assembly protein PilV
MRRGMTIAELLVALFVMTTAMVAMVQLLAAVGGQRRTIEQRRAALIEVANEAEQVALLDWDEISPEEFKTWQPSAELAAALPEATCTAEVTEEISLPAARRIRLSVNWPNASGQLREPIAVTLWKFKEERP